MEKYRRVVRFTMGLHVIHVQERRDPKWLATQYKLIDEDLDMVVSDWPTKWRKLVSAEEVLDATTSPPPDAPMDEALVDENDQNP